MLIFRNLELTTNKCTTLIYANVVAAVEISLLQNMEEPPSFYLLYQLIDASSLHLVLI